MDNGLKTKILRSRLLSVLPEITLDMLVGGHMLDGFDLGKTSAPRYIGCDDDEYEVASCVRFRLDGILFVATEDPNDGYRSCMGTLMVEPHGSIANVFEPIQVVGTKSDARDVNSLRLIDVITGLVVLEVGTDGSEDYYPHWIGNVHPENMVTNQGRSQVG